MIIDFHTHIFPDQIAEKTINMLAKISKIEPSFDGTLEGLISSAKNSGTDLCVVMPVVTNPKQFESVNKFASEINEKNGLISFAGIHPDNENIEEKLKYIKNSGFKGIKLHPDYQNHYIDDEKSINLITLATKQGLAVTIHSGVDPLCPDDVHCSASRAKTMIEEVLKRTHNAENKIILAHFGGLGDQGSDESDIIGKPVFFDLAIAIHNMDKDKLTQLIHRHGAERVLYATDAPWGDQQKDLKIFNSLNLSDEEKELILYKNSQRILNLD